MARAQFDVCRAYDDVPADHWRVLVDRLWPRGVSKDEAPIDEWLKDVAPSTELRRWYGHDAAKFTDFVLRYRDELAEAPASDAVAHLLALGTSGPVALVTATRDVEHSGARVLHDHLVEAGRRRPHIASR